MPPPSNRKEVQSFMGLINYLTKFSPRLTELSEPVRELIKEKVPFNWGPEHQESFEALKKELVKAPGLAYYNPRKETVLQTDTSTKGLGACHLQEDKPIYFASKALTEMQIGYVGIKIESLTVAWAVEKFHHFLYGCHFILETDQKPLEAILSRSLNQATPRIQRILIRTLPYNFTIRYILGTKNLLADCLSWLGNQQDAIKLPKLHVYHISHQLPARSNSLQAIRQATQTDDELALLKHTIMTGWPANMRDSTDPPSILDFSWRTDHWGWSHPKRDSHHHTNNQTRSNSKANPWQPPRAYKMQTMCQGSSILARSKWTTWTTHIKLSVMSQGLQIKKENRWMLYFRPRSPNCTLDKTSNWSISLWRAILSPPCGLHKLISNSQKAYIYDGPPYTQSL